jgi:hypothetical protein
MYNMLQSSASADHAGQNGDASSHCIDALRMMQKEVQEVRQHLDTIGKTLNGMTEQIDTMIINLIEQQYGRSNDAQWKKNTRTLLRNLENTNGKNGQLEESPSIPQPSRNGVATADVTFSYEGNFSPTKDPAQYALDSLNLN